MTEQVREALDRLHHEFLARHRRKEELFWATRMGLSDDHEAYGRAEVEYRRLIGDPERLARLRRLRPSAHEDTERAILDGWIELFARNVIEDASARTLEAEVVEAETELERRRSELVATYEDPATGSAIPASSATLANLLRSAPEEPLRRAAWRALRRVEDFVLDEGFCDLVRLRNRLARRLGHGDYYEWRVRWAEGFGKKTLFALLDDLEERTAPVLERELDRLAAAHGAPARDPWNLAWFTSGNLAAEIEPWFRFEDALERWGRTFAALGIRYRGATVRVDLVDRPSKYENGFMHGPAPAFFDHGTWRPAQINFTANAVPDEAGSGQVAMVTLFHEGGHAAHFANILTDAPCFSQEYAPTSVAFSETQSMFLDALLEDPDWQAVYARDETGRPLPAELLERRAALRQPALAFDLRRLLTVSYFEKALYELPVNEVTPDRVRSTAREVERRLLRFEAGSPRPTLSVPHLLSGDASCYYHGYALAEMAVDQTRRHFLDRYGRIVDEPRVGADLARVYWAPGNAVSFLEYVERLTGRPLSADALVERCARDADEVRSRARRAVEEAEERPISDGPVDLDVNLWVVHGAEVVCHPEMNFEEAAATFRAWVRRRWERPAATARG
jgi:Zn-dependent oligopeptidase